MRNRHVGLVGMMIGVCLLFSMLAGGALPSTTLQAAALAQTQAGTEIAFITVNEQRQATGIDSIKPDGTGRRTIWQYSGSGGAGDINAVRWSPDATELAFTSDIEAVTSAFSADVFGIKPDGTGLRRITNPPSQASIAAGIQNGSLQTGSVRVTLRNDYSATDFVSFFALYIRGAADAEVITVSSFPAFGSSSEVLVPNVADLGVGEPQAIIATWSSGGCNLGKFVSGGFVDVQPGQTVDATVSFTGAGCGQANNALDLSWRRDGQRIGFSLSSLPAQVDVATGSLSDWFDPQGNLVNSAAFAPTDNRVLYEAVGSQSGIYLVPDGQTSGTVVLPRSSLSPETPVWLPAGNGFLFLDLGVLKLADLSGQQIRELARFENGSIRSASVSPDGNAVAIAFQLTGSTASDIYVLDFTDPANPTTRQLTTDGRSTRPDWSRVPPSTPPATPTPTPTPTDAAAATPTPTPTDAAAATPTPTPTDAAAATPTSTPIPTPVLSSNFTEGAPGSAFTFTGTGFPANTRLSITINGTQLASTVESDANGRISFVLGTSAQAGLGRYDVVVAGAGLSVQQSSLATARYTLAADAPVRVPAAGSPPPIIIPASIAPLDPSTLQRVYLPFVVRQT